MIVNIHIYGTKLDKEVDKRNSQHKDCIHNSVEATN